MTWSTQGLASQIMIHTQPSIDRAMTFTRLEGLAEAWRASCYEMAQELLAGPRHLAERAAGTITVFAFQGDPPAEFWASELGQLLYHKGGFPPRNPSKLEASRILGVTHQAVTQMIARGVLDEDNGKVSSSSLRRCWERRRSGPSLEA